MTEAIVFTIPHRLVRFTVEGTPVGKARPRVTRTHTYTPQKTKDYENLIKWAFKSFHKGHKPIPKDTAIILVVYAYFPIPKSTPKKLREKMLKEEVLHTKKPDWDNIGKIVSDALNGLAYEDDSQVMGFVMKLYSDKPRIEVELRWR